MGGSGGLFGGKSASLSQIGGGFTSSGFLPALPGSEDTPVVDPETKNVKPPDFGEVIIRNKRKFRKDS